MTKQDIDQSETSWLIYSDYLEENNQLALAEQIRFELDYRPCNCPPPFSNYSASNVGYGEISGANDIYGLIGGGLVGGYSVGFGGVGGFGRSVGSYGGVGNYAGGIDND